MMRSGAYRKNRTLRFPEARSIGSQLKPSLEMMGLVEEMDHVMRSIFELRSCGLSNKEVSSLVGISESGIRGYITRIKDLLGVKTIDEMIVVAVICGVLTQSSFDRYNSKSPLSSKPPRG